jgi:hypothetical protein
VQAWALAGDNTVLLWARQEGRTWRRVIVDKTPFPPDLPGVVKFEGLAAGDWRMEVWDTWKGASTSITTVRVGIDGKVRLPIPVVVNDIAIKLTKVSASSKDKASK